MYDLTNHLRKRYLWAASVLLFTISLSVGYVIYVSNMQENDAKIINIAGMQRMLSQKIALHRQLLNYDPAPFEEVQLRVAVDRLIANHDFLLASVMFQHPEVSSLLAHNSSLDKRIRAYAKNAVSGEDMSRFSGRPLASLLQELNLVVSALERRSAEKVEYLQRVLPLLILIAILTIWCEWFLIFKPLSKRVSDMLSKLREQKRVATHASRVKDDFLANVSHELFTPINGILGLLKEPAKVSQKDVEVVINCTQNLRSTVQQMLDIQQLKSGRFLLSKSTQPLSTTIKSTLAPHRLNTYFAHRIKLHCDEIDRVRITTDHVRLIQVLNQVLTNALIHTQGEVIIEAHYHPLDECICVDIRDFGDGIDVRDLEAARRNSLHYDNHKVHDFKGVKLGLSLAFAITRLAQGQLHFEHLKNGTLAQLVWPAVNANSENRVLHPGRSRELKALIVEDNDINQMVLRNIIEMFDFEVDSACDGVEALGQVKRNHYDCIFMDINMPNMDGIEATKRIRTELKCDTPILLVTASQDEFRIKQGVRAGANAVIHKPIEIDHVKAALEQVQLLGEFP
ncbi:response regulator [Pseudoalteromonas pernae]|uniref:response regulator n=1 Tax=Pseudoalteromonas pernae TaxID=3118054 RepID=UPI0032421244